MQIRFMLVPFPFARRSVWSPRAVAKASSNTRGYPARHYSFRARSLSSVAGRRPASAAETPREAWFTLKLEGRLPPATGVHRDGIAPGAQQPSETEVSRQRRGRLSRLIGRPRGRLFI